MAFNLERWPMASHFDGTSVYMAAMADSNDRARWWRWQTWIATMASGLDGGDGGSWLAQLT
jgi:hypothetical protein